MRTLCSGSLKIVEYSSPCVHILMIHWEAGEIEMKRSWRAMLWNVYFIPKRVEVIKARNTSDLHYTKIVLKKCRD